MYSFGSDFWLYTLAQRRPRMRLDNLSPTACTVSELGFQPHPGLGTGRLYDCRDAKNFRRKYFHLFFHGFPVLVGGHTIKKLPGIVVYPIFYFLYLVRRISADIGSFRDKAADQTIGIFITAPLIRGIWMAVVKGCPLPVRMQDAFFHAGYVGKLHPVIYGNSFENSGESFSITQFQPV